MQRYGIINVLRNYCADHNIAFLPGLNAPMALSENLHTYERGQLILVFDYTTSVAFSNRGGIVSRSYNCIFALGRKYDDGITEANLNEVYLQKYDRRLHEIEQMLEDIVRNIACENELIINNYNVEDRLNDMDTVIDFKFANVTISQ